MWYSIKYTYPTGDRYKILIKLVEALMEGLHLLSTPAVAVGVLPGEEGVSSRETGGWLHQLQHRLLTCAESKIQEWPDIIGTGLCGFTRNVLA